MIDLNALTLEQLAETLLNRDEVGRLLDLTLDEDLAEAGDITTASIVDPDQPATGRLGARGQGVVSGLATVQRLLCRCELPDALHVVIPDGEQCKAGQTIATLACPLALMLRYERPVLNLLGRLSGIATATREYVQAVVGTEAVICDTRKTVPGMRLLEKYAVRCGGGILHRLGLHDAVLYKDNHIAHIPPEHLATRLGDAARHVRERHDVRFVEVEVDSLAQFEQVLAIEPGLVDMVLLDNMSPDLLRRAVQLRDGRSSRIQLEASGGVDLISVRAIAEAGVNRIAVGAITHGAKWLDIGLDVDPHAERVAS